MNNQKCECGCAYCKNGYHCRLSAFAGFSKAINGKLKCQKSESPTTPKLSDSDKLSLPCNCGTISHETGKEPHKFHGNNLNLGKTIQPDNKPSTDWGEELKRDCKILQKYGEDTDYIIENTVIPFFHSLLQKERERCCEVIKANGKELIYLNHGKEEPMGMTIDYKKVKQQILKDNQ